jgi:hypothetical protein
MVFAVVARIGEQTTQAQLPGGLTHGFFELDVIVGSPEADDRAAKQVAVEVADRRQLAIARYDAPASSRPLAIDEVARTVARVEARRIDGPARLRGDQAL